MFQLSDSDHRDSFGLMCGRLPASDRLDPISGMVGFGLVSIDDFRVLTDEIRTFQSQLAFSEFFPSGDWFALYTKAWPKNSKAYSFKYQASDSDRPVYAIASASVRKSRLGTTIRSLSLNEAPAGVLPDAHIEKNGFVGADLSLTAKPLRSFVIDVFNSSEQWDEIRLNSMDSSCSSTIKKIAFDLNLLCFQTYSARSFLADFSVIRALHQGDFLQSRSTNTRAQLRQAIRKIERSFGTLQVNMATSTEQAQAWLLELAELHRERWNKNGEKNNFNDEAFTQFLSANIDALLPVDKLALLKVSANNRTLAIYYYYVMKQKVYFFIGGVDYSVGASLRPGLVSHFYAAQFFFQSGKVIYDFMEGESRYKESLSTSTSINQGWVLQKKNTLLNFEHKLRQIKRAFSKNRVPENLAITKELDV
jgi:Acetyltransferase (GNAT) domain